MKNKLLEYLFPLLVKALLNSFDLNDIKRELDAFIDRLENRIELSDSKVDDSLLPLIYALRNVFDIPDYPDDAPQDTPS